MADANEKGTSSFLQDLRDALRGASHDYTSEAVGRSVLLLSVPMVLELVMEAVFSVVDVFFVGKLGPDAVAVVGITEAVMMLVTAVGIGLSIGAAAVIARRIGEKDHEEAAASAAQAVYLGVTVCLPIAVVGLLFPRQILQLMGAEPHIVEMGYRNLQIMLVGNATLVLLCIMNGIYRGAGCPIIAMRVLWLANIVNIVLDPLLIFGVGPFPEMGVAGAAVATNIGRGVGVAMQLYLLLFGACNFTVKPRHLPLRFDILAGLARLSSAAAAQMLTAMSSWVVLVRMIAVFGSTAVAGYTIGVRVILFALTPAYGMANAAAVLMGQNLGAGNPDRAARAVWTTSFYALGFLGAVMTVFLFFAEPIIGLFTAEPEVIKQGAACVRIISLGYPAYAIGMVLLQALNGAGASLTSTAINFISYWVLQLPLAWLLASAFQMEAVGVYIGIAGAEVLLAFLTILVFNRGKWREIKI